MELDHQAIYEAYKNEEKPVVTVSDESGAFAQDGTKIELDNTKIANARAFLDAEYAKVKYKDDRATEYPDWGTQLDYIYHNGIDKWKTDVVDPVKKKYPKPE